MYSCNDQAKGSKELKILPQSHLRQDMAKFYSLLFSQCFPIIQDMRKCLVNFFGYGMSPDKSDNTFILSFIACCS